MKILVGIPCLYGATFIKDCVDSVLNNSGGVEILLIDNGAEKDVSELIDSYKNYVHIIKNDENIFVNPAWNQIIEFFLEHEYDCLVIMNSDLTMQKDWSEVLKRRYYVSNKETMLPVTYPDRNDIDININPDVSGCEIPNMGTNGIFITLTSEQAKIIYPIPSEIKVWFGDDWIYGILRGVGHVTVIPNNLIAYHGLSQTIQRVDGIDKLINQDKIEWEKLKERMNEVITKYKP